VRQRRSDWTLSAPCNARRFLRGLVGAAIFVIALIIWQGIAAHGTPDPMQPGTSSTTAFIDIGILVLREGLECILVLAAITATMTGKDLAHRRPVAIGAAMAFVATLITWFIAIEIVGHLGESVPALDLQAATGLVAIIVLLVIMNWFFHKIYWGSWIRAHNRRRKALLASSNGERSSQRLLWGLILLGFTSLYREGFEVVLFLQGYNLRLGSSVVLKGALLGLLLSAIVAVLTFVLQQHLPHRKMLITTGILLGVVLQVMVGEQAQEMQLAHWIPTTDIVWLANVIPNWMGMWFAVFPTYETMIAQLIAAVLVVGSYYAAAPIRRVWSERTGPGWQMQPDSPRGFRRPQSLRTVNDCSLGLCSRQSAPSLQTADCIAAKGNQPQLLQIQQRVPQLVRGCRLVRTAIPDY
jgi:high-affinity iron transporter